MSNPALNDNVFRKAKEEELAGWAAPHGTATGGATAPVAPYSNAPGAANFGPQGYPQQGYPQQGYPQQPGYPPQGYAPPPTQSGGGWGAQPSPVSPWAATPDGYSAMRLSGVVSATGVLLCLLVASAFFGWQAVHFTVDTTTNTLNPSLPPLMIIGILVGFGLNIGLRFAPKLARFLAPLYAIAEGYALGALSHIYESYKSGLVVEAVFCTLAVFGVMLFLFAFRIIKVTQKMRSIVFAAVGGLMLIYLIDIVMSAFGSGLPVINDGTPIGILFSVGVCILAAFLLIVQFDFVDRGIKMGAPRYMEWYSGFALLAAIVFIYLEVLQLLAKLRGGGRR